VLSVERIRKKPSLADGSAYEGIELGSICFFPHEFYSIFMLRMKHKVELYCSERLTEKSFSRKAVAVGLGISVTRFDILDKFFHCGSSLQHFPVAHPVVQSPFAHDRFNPTAFKVNVSGKIHVDVHSVAMFFEDAEHVGIVNHNVTFFLFVFPWYGIIVTCFRLFVNT